MGAALSHAVVLVLTARSTRTSPLPMRDIGAPTPGHFAGFRPMFVSAVFISICLISLGVRAGKASTSSAAVPVTTGAEAEVPANGVRPVAVPASALMMSVQKRAQPRAEHHSLEPPLQ